MMQTLPTSISMFGREIIVEKVDEFPKQVGGVVFDTNTIKIKSGQQLLMEADTLLHECFHLVDDCMQLNLSERQVYCLAVATMALLRENRNLLDYFREAVEQPRKV